tara:strand:+ start:170 stop:376 length:207 start_codon:yes stop_codon:yes gene_type:complete
MLPIANRFERRNARRLSLKGRKRVQSDRCHHGVEIGLEEKRDRVSGGGPPGASDSMRRGHEIMTGPEL